MEKQAYSILIVDDQLENINQIITSFKANNLPYDTLLAFDGEMALKVMERTMPDLIITDWEMPKMDGIAFIKKVKENKTTQDIPIIMCTGVMTTAENLQTALNAGAVDYIKKPVNAIELTARVNSMLQLSSLYKQVKKQNEKLESANNQLSEALFALKRAQVQFLYSERTAALGIIMATISHEINNPLNYVKVGTEALSQNIGFFHEYIQATKALHIPALEQLEKKLALESVEQDIKGLFEVVQEGTDKIVDIIKILNTFVQINGEEFTRVNLSKNLEGVLIVLRNRFMGRIEIEANFKSDLTPLNCNISKISQLFLILLLNASEAIEKKGVISVSTFETEDFIGLSISDNGKGIPKHIQPYIFDAFVTTKERALGTGLYIAKEIVEEHKGIIEFDSSENGTNFRVLLRKA